jgi:hypothetical protein
MPNTTTPRKFLRQTGTGTPKRSLSVKEYEFTDGQAPWFFAEKVRPPTGAAARFCTVTSAVTASERVTRTM